MSRHQAQKTRKPSLWRRYRSLVYIILGVLVLLAPVVLTHYKNVEQHRIAEYYSESVAKLSEQERSDVLEAARQYNQELPSFGSPDPWVNGIDTSTPLYQKYLSHLNVEGTMARLYVPSVGIDLPVYHGTSNATLAHGVGHLYGTALPVGGEGTHSVLTGHTGLSTLTMFDNLTHMQLGDVFIVEAMGEKIAYKVDQINVVLPEDVEHIRPEAGRDLLTLITCTPYGINSHRLLVRGERTELPSGEIAQQYKSPWQPWMIAAIIISLAALLYLLWWLRRRRKKEQEAAQDHKETPSQQATAVNGAP